MSNLDPPAGSTQRDEIVEQLQKENCLLKERLQISQRVEIVSEGQQDDDEKRKIVHADGNLDEGQFQNAGHLFSIDLNKKDVCRLSNLKHVRICVGGFHRACLREQDIAEISFVESEDDTDTSKSMSIGGGRVGLFWLGFTIYHWPKEHYEGIVANEHRYLKDEMELSLFEYITLCLPELFPNAYVIFHNFTLNVSDNRSAIDNLPESVLSTLEEGLDIETMRMNLLTVVLRLFDYRYSESELWSGSSVRPEERLAMGYHVQMILIQFYGIRVVDSDSAQTIDRVIVMYWECRSMMTSSEEGSDWEEEFFRRVLTETKGADRAAEAAKAYSFTRDKNGLAPTGPDMVNDGDTDNDNSDYDEDVGNENVLDSNDD